MSKSVEKSQKHCRNDLSAFEDLLLEPVDLSDVVHATGVRHGQLPFEGLDGDFELRTTPLRVVQLLLERQHTLLLDERPFCGPFRGLYKKRIKIK
jgi:hypothetical protein